MWIAWDDDDYWWEQRPIPTSCAPKKAAALIALEHKRMLTERRIQKEMTEDRLGLLGLLRVLP